jgi:hypothetical protein
MSAHHLEQIKRVFDQCLRGASVFDRVESDGKMFETNDYRSSDGKCWVVIGAGLGKAEAKPFFKGNPSHAKNAEDPIRYRSSCEVSILFVARPCGDGPTSSSKNALRVPFSEEDGVPWIELRHAAFRVWDIPKNDRGITSLRWEWEPAASSEPTLENELAQWQRKLGFNPSHPPSHLHLNTDRPETGPGPVRRPGDTLDDLRLAIGNPNPLAMILSLGIWLQRLR